MADLTTLPVFDEGYADCENCELKPRCDKGKTAYAYRPKRFNGIMVIGEGPGQHEVAEGRPFVGRSGKLLRVIMESVDVDLDDCFVSNSTLCKPPPKDKALHEDFPRAIPSCLGRLEAEIAAVKPRVILTLGASAFVAVSGYDKDVVKNVRFDCDNCDENRKVGPVLQCSAKVADAGTDGTTATACGHLHFLNAKTKEGVDPDELHALKAGGCQKCGARMKRVRPKMVKCPVCGGRKMRQESTPTWCWDYSLGKIAGAIFEPGAEGRARKEHELDPWFAAQGVKYIIPTYHPAFLLRDKQFLAKAVQKHILKAQRLVQSDLPYSDAYEKTADAEVVQEYIWGGWGKDGASDAPNVSVDTETEAVVIDSDGNPQMLDARVVQNVTAIKVIGLKRSDRQKPLVVDTREVDPADDDDALLNTLHKFMKDERIPKTYHNGACYDIPVIDLVWGIPWQDQVGSYWDDTLAAHVNLYPDEPHDLGHVTFSFTNARAWKPAKVQKGVEVHESFDELCQYNARDVINTDAAREAMGVDGGVAFSGGRMHRNGLAACYAQDARMRQIAVGMTMVGMPVNHEKWQAAGEDATRHVEDATHRVRAALEHTAIEPEVFNPFSPKQLVEVLFSEGGFNLPVVKYTDKRKTTPSTDESVLHKLIDNDDSRVVQFIQALLDVREHNKTRKTYIYSPKMQPWADGRIHPVWKPWGARTGRLSSSPNAQNWPKWLRSIIEAAEGRKIVGADYDQLELRGLAALSGDPTLIDKCLNADDQRKLEPEYDPHSFVAALAFKAQYVELSLKDPKHDKKDPKCKCGTCKRKALRDLIKRVIYGMNYGSGDATVLAAIYSGGDYSGPPITIEMVAHVRKSVYKAFDHIPDYQNRLVQEAHEHDEVRSPIVRRRRIFPLSDIPITEIYNYPIQSLGADIINEATVLLDERMADIDPTASLIIQGHDALYTECAEDKAEDIAKLMTETMTMEKTLVAGGTPMLFTAQAVISDNWKDAG